jgi:hypothetical protein
MRLTAQMLVTLTLFSGAATAAAIDITTCGQLIPAGETGILQNDLTCDTGAVLSMGSDSTFELNGHTITKTGNGTVLDVHSPGGHKIRGPGQLVNVSIACGVGFDYDRKLHVEGIDIVSTTYGAIDCLDQGGLGDNRLTVKDVNVTAASESAFGILGRRVKVSDVTIEGTNLIALLARRLKGKNVTIIGNAGRAVASDMGYVNNVTLINSEIRDNAGPGVVALSIRLRSTTVTGNGGVDNADLESTRAPILRGSSTCDRSLYPGNGMPWGVCTDD